MEWFFEAFLNFFLNWGQNSLLDMTQGIIDLVLSITDDFWNDPTITYLLDFSSWVNALVFVISLVFLLLEIVEEAGGRGVDWAMVFTNMAKSLVFVFGNRWLALLSVQLADILVKYMDMRSSLITLQTDIREIISRALGTNPMTQGLMVVAILVVSGIFFVVALRRFGSMLLHIFTSSFYIADVVRGDTSKMGDWLRQMVAISSTFVFQYLFYYLGILFFTGGKPTLGMASWLCITMVGKVLQRYGYSTGTSGALGAIGRTAGFGLTRLIKI